MKPKVQIIDSTAFGLELGWRSLADILRLGWLPLLLLLGSTLIVESYVLEPAAFEGFEISEDGEFDWESLKGLGGQAALDATAFTAPQFWGACAMGLIGFILIIPLMVRFTQVAAGQADMPGGYFFFRWGGREWRTIAIHLILAGLFAVAAVLAIIPGVAVLAISKSQDIGSPLDAVGIILLVLAGIGLFWAGVRASQFYYVTAIENRLAPAYAFGLTGGNFWRIIATSVLTGLALILITMVLGFILLGTEFGLMALVPASADIAVTGVVTALEGLVDLYGTLVGFAVGARIWAHLKGLVETHTVEHA